MNMDENMKKEHEATMKILTVLSDYEWHKIRDFKENHVSSKTFYTKFLKRFKPFVEKRRDETGEYPYPVYYRMKPMLGFSPIEEIVLIRNELEDLKREFLEKKSIPTALRQIRTISDMNLTKALVYFKTANIKDIEDVRGFFEFFAWQSYKALTLKLAELSIKFTDEIDFEKAVKEIWQE
jgi:hypothetical protein